VAVGAQEKDRETRRKTMLFTPSVLAEDLEDVGEQGDARAEEDQADEVERVAALGTVIRHVAENEIHPGGRSGY
jgi:hypothetical protein